MIPITLRRWQAPASDSRRASRNPADPRVASAATRRARGWRIAPGVRGRGHADGAATKACQQRPIHTATERSPWPRIASARSGRASIDARASVACRNEAGDVPAPVVIERVHTSCAPFSQPTSSEPAGTGSPMGVSRPVRFRFAKARPPGGIEPPPFAGDERLGRMGVGLAHDHVVAARFISPPW